MELRKPWLVAAWPGMGSVGLRAEGDFRPEQDKLALAHRYIDSCHAVFQIMLAPRPSTAERIGRVEPRQRTNALQDRFRR